MGYRLKRDESVTAGVRRIAHEELDEAVAQLSPARSKNRDDAIHEARKSVKKVRALLRLVQPEMGDAYREETRTLRDAGRTLSELRDARSVIESLEKLQQGYPNELRRSVFDAIRRGLLTRKKEREQQEDIPAVLRKIATELKAAGKRAKRWPLATDGFPALESGLEKMFRKSRAAFSKAQKRPTAQNYHEWRKRLKDHWYHIRVLESTWTEVMQGYEAALKDVETWIGDDHNLVLLRQLLTAEPQSFGGEKSAEPVIALIDKEQKRLRDNAESVARRIYQEKPRKLVRRLRQLWREWQAEPKSLEDFEKKARKHQAAA